MRDVELWILTYLLNSLWQIPLLFGAGWLAARALRPAGAEVEHRVWVTTLALQCLLPAASIFPIDWLRTLSLLSWGPSHSGQAYVSVTMGEGTGIAPIPLPAFLLEIVAVFYALVSAYFVARFLWRGMNLSLLR